MSLAPGSFEASASAAASGDAGPRPRDCAREILDTVPAVMHRIRLHMRTRRGPGLSVPQFRALVFVHLNPRSSLSALAEFLGLAPPAASKLAEHLVRRGLLLRESDARDRRRITLAATRKGQVIHAQARRRAQAVLARDLTRLPPAERRRIACAMATLRRLLAVEVNGRSVHPSNKSEKHP